MAKKRRPDASDASPAFLSLQNELDQDKFRDAVQEIGVDEYARRVAELYEEMFGKRDARDEQK